PGETFLLGASTWRIQEITRDRVVVTPAPGEPGKMPFWHGDRPGRPIELGRALGATVREIGALGTSEALAQLHDVYALDDRAAQNLLAYLREQAEATGVLPDDRTIVVERFPDEIGDWRVCLLSPFGSRVHAPWALALETRLSQRLELDVQVLWSDDGIVVRLPESVESLPIEELLLDPDEVDELVLERLPATALFASRFREAAARALLLPRHNPGQRTALWQQRQRAADLLDVASRHPSFPILLETTRECVRDVFDLPALRGVLSDLRSRTVRMVAVDTRAASPFAQSLLFGWIAADMYEGDAPLAERRAAALALDRDLLRDLLGGDELRELLDPEAIAELELELQHLGPDTRPARDADELHDLLRDLGDLTPLEIATRSAPGPAGDRGHPDAWIERLLSERRAISLQVAGEARVAAAEDAARFRDALGAALPSGLPGAFTEPVPTPLDDLVARYARTHTPFVTGELAARLGISPDRVVAALGRLVVDGRVVSGEFRPDGLSTEWSDVGVLRRLRRRSLARLRNEVEPVEAVVLGRFLPAWQGVGSDRHGLDALVDTIGQLQGIPIVASSLEADVLAARLRGYSPAQLDELSSTGELVWVGAGAIGANDGRVMLSFRDRAALLLPDTGVSKPEGVVHDAIRARLATSGASFWPDLLAAAGTSVSDAEILTALWDLVWAGEVTNDTLAPLRAVLGGRTRRQPPRGRPRPGRLTRLGPPAGAGRWSSVAALREPAPSPTERAHALAQQLLERQGVVTREAVRAEGVAGGFAAVYPVLRALEETGRVRRGYFVAGLGAAQFALPGAVDRLRSHRITGPEAARDLDREASAIVLTATDPAQPYGAALPWPQVVPGAGRPTRAAGAFVILVDGAPAAYLERGGRSLVLFASSNSSDGTGDIWIEPLATLVKDGRVAKLELQRIDGAPVRESPAADALRAAGFRDAYRGLVLRD
ncbi:MAG: Lhr family helicase, partial [Acidimicrobiia bacterium]